MRIINEKFETITEYDLTKGQLTSAIVIREDVEPINNINKFVWADDDYEEVQMYVPYPPVDNTPSQLDEIQAQVAYTAMMTDTLIY